MRVASTPTAPAPEIGNLEERTPCLGAEVVISEVVIS
jgi:hypothetical protein